jgi:hypothetical protein
MIYSIITSIRFIGICADSPQEVYELFDNRYREGDERIELIKENNGIDFENKIVYDSINGFHDEW